MRVVAGSAGGIPLVVPRGDTVRPTMDRVKAAIFSSLGERVPGARVLDLFAGSGALGIEALSRGCAAATFVENHAAACAAIRSNLEKTRLSGTVFCRDIFTFLGGAASEFDIIFADPPYAKADGARDFGTELLLSPNLPRFLAPDGVFVLEKMPRSPLNAPSGWELLRLKKYGSTEVAILSWNPRPDPAGQNPPERCTA